MMMTNTDPLAAPVGRGWTAEGAGDGEPSATGDGDPGGAVVVGLGAVTPLQADRATSIAVCAINVSLRAISDIILDLELVSGIA